MNEAGYHLLEGELGSRLAKGWRLQAQSIDEKPTAAKMLFLPPDISEQWIPGAKIRFWGRFSSPSPQNWPGTFNWGRYLAKEELCGTITADNPSDIQTLSASKGPFSWLHRAHEKLLSLIADQFEDKRISGVLSGLLLGDKRLVETSLKKSFIRSGAMHLLVASGLHVALAFAFVLGLCLWLGAPRFYSSMISLAFMWIFSVFIGMNAPILRACLMLTFLGLPGLRRDSPALARLFLAALALLIFSPSLIEDASFLLSFVSTFGILYGAAAYPLDELPSWKRGAANALMVSFFAWISLLPFSAYFFHEISFSAPIANLILVPFSSLLLGLGAFHFAFFNWIPGLEQVSLWCLRHITEFFLMLVDFFGSWPYARFSSAAWGMGILGAWLSIFLFTGGFLTRARAVWVCSIFIAFSLISRSLRPLQAEIFNRESPILYLSSGWSEGYYLKDSSFAQSASWREFMTSRGERAVNLCASSSLPSGTQALAPMPFEDFCRIRISCRGSSLIFPLSRLKSLEEESISAWQCFPKLL